MGKMEFSIGNRKVGVGHPTFVVAEMSGNHGGKLENALRLIHVAKKCGADAVKIQSYTADTITLDTDREDFLLKADNPWHAHKNLYQLYKSAQTPWEWHEPLFAEARKVGIEIFSSPFDETAVDLLESLSVKLYKIASPEITHIPLLEKVAKTGKPVILSTGISNREDVELAVSTLRKNGCDEIVILKCTTSYPAPIEDSNLRTIQDIPKTFGCLSGLSDHTVGITAPLLTVALGGSVIEKHFTITEIGETVDSFFSSDEEEFATMVTEIRNAEKALGKVSYDIPACALPNLQGRRSLYVSADIKAGEPLTTKNIKCVRPSFGMHPKHFSEVLGKRAKVDLRKGDRLSWDKIG